VLGSGNGFRFIDCAPQYRPYGGRISKKRPVELRSRIGSLDNNISNEAEHCTDYVTTLSLPKEAVIVDV
jgi:hypothetical protein